MGCSQSKIENEEAVSRCKERKQLMKDAVAARNAFAAGHCAYAMSLKNTGAALSDYAPGEVQNPHSITTASLPSLHPIESLPPPPPPVPEFPSPQLQRAVSMPEYVVSKPIANRSATIIEEEDEYAAENEGSLRRSRNNKSGGGGGGSVGGRVRVEDDAPPSPPSPPVTSLPNNSPPPPPPPEASNSPWDYFFSMDNMPGGSLGDVEDMRRKREEMEKKVLEERSKRTEIDGGHAVGGVGVEGSMKMTVKDVAEPSEKVVEKPPFPPQHVGAGKIVKRGGKQVVKTSGSSDVKRVEKNVNLLQIFNDLDDCFLKASESAHEVSKMLEAARLHYHSNFADNRGHIDHSARVMRVITWNRSFRGLPNADYGKDDFDLEENETHATVLDKLLAWEKKLYDEVKAGELMKFEYQRKVALLNKQKKRGTKPEALEKTKAAVSHLHTRYIVDMQSLDAAVLEINRLRDEQLYPKLVALVNTMATMWETMQVHHESQLRIVAALKAVDVSQSVRETTEQHHHRTIQLWAIVQEWHAQFNKMVSHQKAYIQFLKGWLKLNLIPIESSLKEKVSSPPGAQSPPIRSLLFAWHDHLEKLPEELAKSAVYNFEAVLHTIVQQQEDEMKLRAKCEESRKDFERKTRQYEDWYSKYLQKRSGPDEMDLNGPEDGTHRDPMGEKQAVVEAAKVKLEEDEKAYERQCIHVREKSLVSFKTRLPELFRATLDFAVACSVMYRNLSSISESLKQES
ncbi:hypothetical protein Nepgr_019507 [Nepenthes gracilis]|uniref:Nitrate regulatory gene2 protein-like n=1 Tax=Nepenthes gracilis TaxID=150966 RepID=A0AAD3SVG0_NEPGR|nr:hypothetical protein Nepgr_019507 [Nepenthes gracilis]